MDAQPLETLFLSVITVAELRLGVARLPNGRRCEALAARLETQILPTFAGRILAFDLAATKAYAELMSRSLAKGKAIGMADGMIAAIALTHGMTVATRDTVPFETVGIAVLNPWFP